MKNAKAQIYKYVTYSLAGILAIVVMLCPICDRGPCLHGCREQKIEEIQTNYHGKATLSDTDGIPQYSQNLEIANNRFNKTRSDIRFWLKTQHI